jgi:hypothetical protein
MKTTRTETSYTLDTDADTGQQIGLTVNRSSASDTAWVALSFLGGEAISHGLVTSLSLLRLRDQLTEVLEDWQ